MHTSRTPPHSTVEIRPVSGMTRRRYGTSTRSSVQKGVSTMSTLLGIHLRSQSSSRASSHPPKMAASTPPRPLHRMDAAGSAAL